MKCQKIHSKFQRDIFLYTPRGRTYQPYHVLSRFIVKAHLLFLHVETNENVKVNRSHLISYSQAIKP